MVNILAVIEWKRGAIIVRCDVYAIKMFPRVRKMTESFKFI